MSVGRIDMHNHKTISSELCWVNGFKKLNDNKHSRAQLRSLDKYKAKQFGRLLKALKTSPLILDQRKIRIGKNWFTSIAGVSKIDSENIRIELANARILNKKYELTEVMKLRISEVNFNLGLSNQYSEWNDEICLALILDPDDMRVPSIYGKPFSYYYNIIDKNKLASTRP